MKIAFLLIIGLLGSILHASECSVESRLCDLERFLDGVDKNQLVKPLQLSFDDYIYMEDSFKKRIKHYYVIVDDKGVEIHSLSKKSIKFAMPINLPFESLMVMAQNAYFSDDKILAYRILRYSKPNPKKLVDIIDQLTQESPYRDRFNCYVSQEFGIRYTETSNEEVQTKYCDVSLLDLYIAMNGEVEPSKYPEPLKIVDNKNSTCLYYKNTKRCFKARSFKRYKESLVLLTDTFIYNKNKGAELMVVPSVKR